jgi:hypothetical protein
MVLQDIYLLWASRWDKEQFLKGVCVDSQQRTTLWRIALGIIKYASKN